MQISAATGVPGVRLCALGCELTPISFEIVAGTGIEPLHLSNHSGLQRRIYFERGYQL
jgi:hypothetical protein